MPRGRPEYTGASLRSERAALHVPRAATVHTRRSLPPCA
jgi:hypothetical protein